MAQTSEQSDVKPDVASSLAVSTRRFVDGLARRCLGHLLDGHQVSQPIDYFKLADELGIQRRRVYDIINVLEGMRLVAKSSKGRLFCSPVLAYAAAVRAKLDAIIADTQRLLEYEGTLDSALESAEAELSALMAAANGTGADSQLYVSADDIANLPLLQDMSAVGISLPVGGTMSAHSLPQAAVGVAAPSSATSARGRSLPSTAAAGDSSTQEAQHEAEYTLVVAGAAPSAPQKPSKGGSRRSTQTSASAPRAPDAHGTVEDIHAILISRVAKHSESDRAASPSAVSLVRGGAVDHDSGALTVGAASQAMRDGAGTPTGDSSLDALLADARSDSTSPVAAGPTLAALGGEGASVPPPISPSRRNSRN